MATTMADFFAFCRELFDARCAEPTDDIASLLANAETDGAPVPFGDFVGNLILVLVGGNETTRNSLSHSVAAFSADPAQWQAIRDDRALFKTAIPELVRFASPVMHMRRTATADTTIGGRPIARGDKVVLWYISGNRDESVFPDGDRLDLARRGPQHVGFGAGQHVCVGSRLAEMQLRIAFDILADRVATFEVQAPPRRFRSNFINGLKNLNVVLRSA